MPPKPLSRKVAARLRKLAAVLVSQLDEEPEAVDGWESAVLDIRYPSAGDSCMTKFTALLVDGRSAVLRETTDTFELIDAVRALPAEELGGAWWGLKLTVAPGGGYEAELNRDRQCSTAPDFWPQID